MARPDDNCAAAASCCGEARTVTAITVREFVMITIDGPVHLYSPPCRIARKVSEGL